MLLFFSLHPSKSDNVTKKKKKAGNEIRSEDIEGHIGYKDIDYLAKYVSGSKNDDSTSSSDVKSLNLSSKEVKDKKKSTLNNSSSINNNGRKKVSNSYNCVSNTENKSENEQNDLNDSHPLTNDSGLAKSIPSCSSNTTLDSKCSLEIAQNRSRSEIDSLATSPELSKSQLPPPSLNESPKLNFSINLAQSTSFQSSDLESSCFDKDKCSNNQKKCEYNISDEDKKYAASDSEMVDQESGFQPIKSKHIRKRKARLRKIESVPKNAYLDDVSTRSSLDSSNSRPPINNAVFTRGYESEREYCADEYRKRKEHQSRKKLASSMPHSEQNSADNSDLESSFSFPVTGRMPSLSSPPLPSISSTPKVSYADIAKMGPSTLGSLPPTNTNTIVNSSNQVKNSKSTVNSSNTLIASNSIEAFNCEASKMNSLKSLNLQEKDLERSETATFKKSYEIVSLNEDKGFNINLAKSAEVKLSKFEIKSNTESDSKIDEALISPFVNKSSFKFDIVNKRSNDIKSSTTLREELSTSRETKQCSRMIESNSITEYNVKSEPHRSITNQTGDSLPPVIMYDDSNVKDDVSSSFTFGFFDVQQPSDGSNSKSYQEKLGSVTQTAKEVPPPEAKVNNHDYETNVINTRRTNSYFFSFFL